MSDTLDNLAAETRARLDELFDAMGIREAFGSTDAVIQTFQAVLNDVAIVGAEQSPLLGIGLLQLAAAYIIEGGDPSTLKRNKSDEEIKALGEAMRPGDHAYYLSHMGCRLMTIGAQEALQMKAKGNA